MTEWRDRKRAMDPNSAGAQGLTSSGGPVAIPLGSGEWDEGLGIPMCVVCQGVCTTHLIPRTQVKGIDAYDSISWNRPTRSKS